MPGKPLVIEKKINTSFTLSPKAIEIIDEDRGYESRSSFVDRLVLASHGLGEQHIITPNIPKVE
jgi:hypothetical protein